MGLLHGSFGATHPVQFGTRMGTPRPPSAIGIVGDESVTGGLDQGFVVCVVWFEFAALTSKARYRIQFMFVFVFHGVSLPPPPSPPLGWVTQNLRIGGWSGRRRGNRQERGKRSICVSRRAGWLCRRSVAHPRRKGRRLLSRWGCEKDVQKSLGLVF